MFEGLLQPMHLIVILAIVLIFFGPGKLPEIGGAVGKALRGFKQSMKETGKTAEEPKRIENKSAK